jgi:hypothetical protein
MATFWQIWESMQESIQKQPQVEDDDDSKALRVVRTGMGLGEPGSGSNFWDDFASICGDAEGLSDLLGVSRDEISQWPSKIEAAKKRVDSSDDEEGKSDKRELLPTGDPDFATPNASNQDTRQMP